MRRPAFPQREYAALQHIVREGAPQLSELAASVGTRWLTDDEEEALSQVTLNYFLFRQLGDDDEPLPNVGILGDDLCALLAMQRRGYWE